MTYFKDLTPYSYYGNEQSLNIGGLSLGEPFDVETTHQEFREKLSVFCLPRHLVRVMRGLHICEFCFPTEDAWYKKYANKGLVSKETGDGEIRVIGKDVIYAAPALIYHYVIEHKYKPPQEFIEAVVNGPQPGSIEHNSLLEKYRSIK